MNAEITFANATTIDELTTALAHARGSKPRSLSFNDFMREQGLVDQHLPDAQKTLEHFAQRHPSLMSMAEAANVSSNPAFIAAVHRITS